MQNCKDQPKTNCNLGISSQKKENRSMEIDDNARSSTWAGNY